MLPGCCHPLRSARSSPPWWDPMDERFDTMQLPDDPVAVAPDGSDVRELLQLARGSMAHFELRAGRVSRAVAHRSVEEIWYILNGNGQMRTRSPYPRFAPPYPRSTTPASFRSSPRLPLVPACGSFVDWLTHTETWAGSRAWCTTPARSAWTASKSTASFSRAANAAT